jgi:hypothetical protein
MPKYTFTGLTKSVNGVTIHQISRAADALVGGYVQSESNLSQDGSCFLFDQGQAYGNSRILNDAQVYGKVYDSATTSGSSVIKGEVFGNALVTDDAQVQGRVYENAVVKGSGQVFGEAFGNATVDGSAIVYGRIHGTAHASGNDVVYGDLDH